MKPIQITDLNKQKLINEFAAFLTKERFSDSKLNYQANLSSMLPDNIVKPTVYFTPKAYAKMINMVLENTGEVGWHGTVEKDGAVYTITDIVVYPQIVSSATVTTDDTEYASWLMNLPDEIFEKLRFQGHSHVNFGVTPSGVDMNFYDSILQTLTKDDYYIFVIINKTQQLNIMIYDYTQNVIFEKGDINVDILFEDGEHYINFRENYKKLLSTRTYLTTSYEKKKEEKEKEIPSSAVDDTEEVYWWQKPEHKRLYQNQRQIDLTGKVPNPINSSKKGGKKHGSK
jgi:hypothetical protein